MLRPFIKKASIFLSVFLLVFIFVSHAQAPKKYNAAEIQLALNKLNVLGSALYIAAHPDDENTRLIAYLSNEELVNTAYFSVTRGDGGQNLIGTETGAALGLIRTQELLEARKIDGGKQFFSRAIDFGFSKHPDETFNIWEKEEVLADLVWAIRQFQPDVLITRFNDQPGTTHGHHTASTILATEAFEAAANKNRFPEQLKYVGTWQPSRMYWNTSSWFFEQGKFDTTNLLAVDVGIYNTLLGESYSELSAESRSMHKSQGFGSSGSRGAAKEYLQPLKGKEHPKEIFQGINISWNRIKGGERVGTILKKAADSFNGNNPAAILPILLEANKLLRTLPDSYWKSVKLEELQQVIEACCGLFAEALANDFSITEGDSLTLDLELVNRSEFPVRIQKIEYSLQDMDSVVGMDLAKNKVLKFKKSIKFSEGLPYSQPYWLRKEGSIGMFNVKEQEQIGKPENDPAITITFNLLIGDQAFKVKRPLVYKRTDPVDGEQYRRLEIIPPVFINPKEPVMMFASNEKKQMELVVRAGKPDVSGEAMLLLPEGWGSFPEKTPFALSKKGEEATLVFDVIPPSAKSTAVITASATVAGKSYQHGYQSISYPHIPNQLLLPKAEVKAARIEIEKRGEKIGYIMGAGDEVPASLRQIGYQVTLLNDKDITLNNLNKFDAIILGVRAYNTVDKLRFYQATLFEYVNQGGNMIVQFNTNGASLKTDVAPYPMKISRDRVAVEDAAVRFIQPNHPLLNKPNKITEQDFENWVQERGLYFASEWDANFQPILSMNDPGEEPKDGSLLVAQYGQGFYMYTGLSFFRQLAAGVPGAYRLFTNLISIEKEPKQ